MKTVPIYDNFDRKKLIGYMKVDMSKLSIKPNYHFALQGNILDCIIKSDGTREVTSFELTAVSAIPDIYFTDKV